MGMNKVLIVNGGAINGESKGRLNDSLCELAKKTLTALGLEVLTSKIVDGYMLDEEINRFKWADAVIWQFPGWWMGEPWHVKKYVDEVFYNGEFLTGDGRHRTDPKHGYGTGGLLTDKHYMISTTWNAPLEAFIEPHEFFEGVGPDGVLLHFHKLNQFVGMKSLPSFICNDVIKDPQPERYFADYRMHLEKVFARS